MSIYQYLQLQPVDPQDDGTVSTLDEQQQDEVIDLSQETDGEQLAEEWSEIERDLHAEIEPVTENTHRTS